MLSHDDLRYHLYSLLASPAFQQIAPLVFLFLVPTLVLVFNSHRHSIAATVPMVFDSLAAVLPWNWTDATSNGGSSSSGRKLRRKQHARSRDDHIARTSSQDNSYDSQSDGGYYPGLVNISGTYCFMNSTLQAMASLSYLQPQLEKIHARAEALDVPTPVIDTLRNLVNALNNPYSHSRALRPVDIINALSTRNPGKHNSLFSSREHQDAQELFQLLSECVKSEATAVAREIRRDRGLGGLTQKDDRISRDLSQTVFDGLTANRRSCVECGYTEAVMHFPFDNWQLAVPRLVAACHLEDCLDDYTRLELLNDCICRKCSMLATYKRLEHEASKTTEAAAATNDPTSSKKKRARDSRKLLARVKAALDEGRIEEDIKGVKLEKVFSRASTKQSMIARPPSVLALHLNRSMHYGSYAAKNNCRVVFPEILDLTPYTTSGQLSTQPSAPISSPPPPIPIQRSITPTPSTYAVPRTLYRLSAVVCHYGQHSFGHYVCFRRKPRPPAAGDRRYTPPRTQCALGCDCAQCVTQGPIRDEDGQNPARPGTGRGWLRISDDAVQECGIERVLQEGAGAFMLYYERVQQPRSLVYTAAPPRASEETIRPEEAHPSMTSTPTASADGKAVAVSKGHAQFGNGDVVRKHESRERERREEKERPVDPRVVRRVSASAHKPSPSPAPQSQQPQPRCQPHTRPQMPPQPQVQPKPASASTSTSASRPPAVTVTVAPPPPISRSTSGSSAVTAASTFSTNTLASDVSVPNGHARQRSSDKQQHQHSANGSADPSSQRPQMPPPSASKLRKSRRSVSQSDGNPVSSPTTPTPLRA